MCIEWPGEGAKRSWAEAEGDKKLFVATQEGPLEYCEQLSENL